MCQNTNTMQAKDKEFVDEQLRIFSPESVKIWEDEMEENYTINFMLEKKEWRKPYEKLIYEFEKVESGLYIYPFDRLHMTVLGRISVEVDADRICEVLEQTMKGKRFAFNVGYLANNNQGVSIISEPEFDLMGLRNDLRDGIGVSGDDYTKYSNIYERLAWFNFMRFRSKPGYKFFEKLWEMRNYWFGEYEAKDISILKNRSRTLDVEKCTEFKRIVF
jgi:hypothetical protein